MNEKVVHEALNYLHHIIAQAQYIEKNSKDKTFAKKILSAAYKIDALIVDSTLKKESLIINKKGSNAVDYAKFKDLNVLIVDDLVENIKIMEDIFTTLSCNVISAQSGEEAIEICKNGFRPHLVSMDMVMPGIDGYQTTQALKELGSDAYFVAVSALKNQSKEIMSYFDCWLSKPFSAEQINVVLRNYLKKSENKNLHIDSSVKLSLSTEERKVLLELLDYGAYSAIDKFLQKLSDTQTKSLLLEFCKNLEFDVIKNSILTS